MRRPSWTRAWTLLLLTFSLWFTTVHARYDDVPALSNPYQADLLVCPVGARSMGRHCKYRRPQFSRQYYLLCRRRRGSLYLGDGRLNPYERLPWSCPERYLCVGHSLGGGDRRSSISCIASRIVRNWQRNGVSVSEQRRITQPWLTQASTSGAREDTQPATSLGVTVEVGGRDPDAGNDLQVLADVAVRGDFDLNELPEETLSDCDVNGTVTAGTSTTARCSEAVRQVSP